jgi:hypothetical protein
VFVRELDAAEAQRLVKITRTARDRVRLRRAVDLADLARGPKAYLLYYCVLVRVRW